MSATWWSLGWFVMIVAAIPVALWLFKRSGAAGLVSRSAALPLRQVGSLGIGPQQRVVTLEVGQGADRRWLLLGVTPQQIHTLHVLDSWPGAADLGTGSAAEPAAFDGLKGGFGAELARRLRASLGASADAAGSDRAR